MKEPIWVDETDVLAIHERVLAEHGGGSGVRDVGLLKSALARPQQHFNYSEGADIVDLAAIYTAGIVRNHPFVDGNKRTGFVIGILFLELNGYRFSATEEEATKTILALAAGTLKESALVQWMRQNSKQIRKQRP
jgi:death-on-curing protein